MLSPRTTFLLYKIKVDWSSHLLLNLLRLITPLQSGLFPGWFVIMDDIYVDLSTAYNPIE